MKKSRFIISFVVAAMVASGMGSMRSYATGVDEDTQNDVEGTTEVETGGPVDDERIDAVRQAGTWHQYSNGKWRYIHTDGSYTIDDWERIDGSWYYFDGSGYRWTGWKQYNNSWYYFNSNGVMVTGWKKITVGTEQHWYYFKANGKMTTSGWLHYNSQWYYFNANGEMVTGWNTINEYTYYFNNNGEFVNSTRRALIIGDDYYSSNLDMNGWYNCLRNLEFGGDSIVTPIKLVAPSVSGFQNKLRDVMVDAADSDITYLCITCQGIENGSILISPTTKIDGDALRYELDKYKGKVILFLSFDYSGLLIQEEPDRSMTDNERIDASVEEFLSAFSNNSRSGELLDDRFIVFCSCSSDEELYIHEGHGTTSMTYGCANRCWMTGGGWDPDYLGYLQTLYADSNSNSIVSAAELETFSSSIINHQHVVVSSSDENFTVFARTSTK